MQIGCPTGRVLLQAVFGSTLLSSLLQDDLSVFAHLALAIEVFALYPLWCRHVKAFSPDLHYQCAWLSFLLAACCLMPTSRYTLNSTLVALTSTQAA